MEQSSSDMMVPLNNEQSKLTKRKENQAKKTDGNGEPGGWDILLLGPQSTAACMH